MKEIITKASTLLEALPYIQRFRSETFVVKYGGSFMDSPDAEVRNGVARKAKAGTNGASRMFAASFTGNRCPQKNKVPTPKNCSPASRRN